MEKAFCNYMRQPHKSSDNMTNKGMLFVLMAVEVADFIQKRQLHEGLFCPHDKNNAGSRLRHASILEENGQKTCIAKFDPITLVALLQDWVLSSCFLDRGL